MERIDALGNLGNKYYQDTKPWESIKNNPAEAAKVMVTCVNLIKAIAVFLKPVVPAIVKDLEDQFCAQFTLGRLPFLAEKLQIRADQENRNAHRTREFERLFNAAAPAPAQAAPAVAPSVGENNSAIRAVAKRTYRIWNISASRFANRARFGR